MHKAQGGSLQFLTVQPQSQLQLLLLLLGQSPRLNRGFLQPLLFSSQCAHLETQSAKALVCECESERCDEQN